MLFAWTKYLCIVSPNKAFNHRLNLSSKKNNKIVTFVQLVVELISYSAAAQNVFHNTFSAKTPPYIQP